jgi:hypothetical protein
LIVRANTTTWLLNEDDSADEFSAKGLTATDCESLVVGGDDGGIVSVEIVSVVIGCVVVVVGGLVVVVAGFTVVVVVGALVVVVVGFTVVVVVGALVVVVVVGALVVVVVVAAGGFAVVVVVGGGDVVVVTGLEAPAVYSATQSTCSDSDEPDAGHAQPAAHQVCC